MVNPMKEQEKLDRIYENICKKKNCGTCKHCKSLTDNPNEHLCECEVGLKCGTIHQGVKNCPKWERVNLEEKYD